MRKVSTFLLLIFLFAVNVYSQTGKVTGYIKDANTGEALIGANVIIEGTTLGAASNADGYYQILNIPPGTYTLRSTMIGYSVSRVEKVRVYISQTTEQNFGLQDQSFQTGEVVVTAIVPIIQKDVSASTINLNLEEIKNLPVVSVSSVVGLQAGIQGTTIRGGGGDQTSWMLNGVSLRDERTNQPFTGISYTSVEAVQILTGGFNAEYGDIRAGLVNVVTKEGRKDKFTFSMIGRYRPTGPKHFGGSAHDRNSFWMKPFVDDAVAWVGTKNGTWDAYTQAQYPEFEGWNEISRLYMSDDDPSTPALSPQALQKLYLYQHRKNTDIAKPDYDLDMSFGGYFPYISQPLGNLRFLFSYRGAREMYVIPLSRDAYTDNTYQLRLTSDIAPGMKLNVEGFIADQKGTTGSSTGTASIYRSASGIAEAMSLFSSWKTIENRIFTYDYWAPTAVYKNNISAKFTHVVNPETFYDFQISRFNSSYETNPGRWRDTTKNVNIGNGYFTDESPYGFWELPTTGVANFRMSVGFSNSRDSSEVTTYNAKFDIVSQLDKYNSIKAGFEVRYSENLANYAYIDKYLPCGKYRSVWAAYPIRGSVYIQDKLEFEGMVANLGIRFDYSDPNSEWYVWDKFTNAFASENSLGLDTILTKEPTETKLTVSPRLGIAFPITEDSKLFFNYGHFRQMPTPENLYLLRRYLDNNVVTYMANPNNELPRTIAYELGYEQNLFDEFLIRVAGYYRDVSLQPTSVTYVSRNGKVNYGTAENNSYADIRGFEATLTKSRGDWIRGFINYTYMVTTAGRFGFGTYYENVQEQTRYELTTRSNYQERPVPQPYGRMNVDLFTPEDYDPLGLKVGTFYPMGDWTVNLLAVWSSGRYFTWAGGGSIPGLEYNVQWKDYWDFDVKIAKNFNFGSLNFQLFVDINNIFNIKYMSPDYGFTDSKDYEAYMKSLHLPQDAFSDFTKNSSGVPQTGYFNDKGNTKYVFGEDTPGDFRTGEYIPWDENASESEKNEWKKNKSYIDMPNQDYLTFLNLRDYYFGIRLTWDIF